MDLVGVEPDRVEAVWPRVLPWVKANCSWPGTPQTPDELRALVKAGEGALIVILDDANRSVAMVITQVRDYESGVRSCWVVALGGAGHPRLWRGVLRQIEAGARRSGCGRVEFVGRVAWRRVVPGYRATACENGTHYAKDL